MDIFSLAIPALPLSRPGIPFSVYKKSCPRAMAGLSGVALGGGEMVRMAGWAGISGAFSEFRNVFPAEVFNNVQEDLLVFETVAFPSSLG